MKKLFLVSSFAQVAPLFQAWVEAPLAGKSVTFIPTASRPEKVTFYVAAAQKALVRLGLRVEVLDVSQASGPEVSHALGTNDFLYVSGGNTFYLLQELRRSGADRRIADLVEAGKPYLGESAGAMVVAPDIGYARALDDPQKAPDLGDHRGLGLVDFFPLPHFASPPFQKVTKKLFETHRDTLDLVPLSNTQAIGVREGRSSVISPTDVDSPK